MFERVKELLHPGLENLHQLLMIVGVGHGKPREVYFRSVVPSIMARKSAKGTKEPPSNQPEISEEEQWRIVNETGLLKQLPNPPRTARVEEEETPFAEEILNALLLIAPFTFLLVMMDM